MDINPPRLLVARTLFDTYKELVVDLVPGMTGVVVPHRMRADKSLRLWILADDRPSLNDHGLAVALRFDGLDKPSFPCWIPWYSVESVGHYKGDQVMGYVWKVSELRAYPPPAPPKSGSYRLKSGRVMPSYLRLVK